MKYRMKIGRVFRSLKKITLPKIEVVSKKAAEVFRSFIGPKDERAVQEKKGNGAVRRRPWSVGTGTIAASEWPSIHSSIFSSEDSIKCIYTASRICTLHIYFHNCDSMQTLDSLKNWWGNRRTATASLCEKTKNAIQSRFGRIDKNR